MKKNYALLALVFILSIAKGFSQSPHCFTDETYRKSVEQNPKIAELQAKLDSEIKAGLSKIDFHSALRTTDTTGFYTAFDTFWYDIPVVIHIIHDYGAEEITDNTIFNALKDWNLVYSASNPDTVSVIPPFKKYIGNVRIRLHLATKDPFGNPTHGITRHRSYLTYTGGDQSKLDDWSPTSYVNIWTVTFMNASNNEAAAYAYFPSTAAYQAMYDGVISLYDYFQNDYTGVNAVSKTINHEMGHVFNLYHPWGNNNSPGNTMPCGDDAVDDTPPTKGHLYGGCALNSSALYDTACATNYFKVYTSVTGADSFAFYCDTTNAQNIMDYTYCSRMFTKGQVDRMHATLHSDVAGRDSLWTPYNLASTGALAPFPDLKPIPEFSCQNNIHGSIQYFTCPGTKLKFINKSWNDTVTQLEWKFSNGARQPDTMISSTVNFNTNVVNTFSQPGWATITMIPTGNGSGDTTVAFSNAIFVANTTGTPALNYYQEFNPSGDVGNWPLFNYYNNEFKWELSTSVGFYDNTCIKYDGFDNRLTSAAFPFTGQPSGDIDDFFTVPFDLTGFRTDTVCNMNFMYSGASRTSNYYDINDTLEIDYSVDRASSWHLLKSMSKGSLDNMGASSTSYVPTSIADWAPMTIPLPAFFRDSSYVVFRFRYHPNCGKALTTYENYSTGNNFYLDRLSFSTFPAEVSIMNLDQDGIVVVPNPTQNDAFVVIKDAANNNAHITVTDITGKIVYHTEQQITAAEARIQIPQSAIAVKGMYMVQIAVGSKNSNQKLVVY